jgi:hypothetical protein
LNSTLKILTFQDNFLLEPFENKPL